MARITKAMREFVLQRAHARCEYCATQMAIVVEMEIDHIVPESAGGATVEENLALACVSCNAHKSNFQRAEDPDSGEQVRLYNPRTDIWAEHFVWQLEGTLISGVTAIGRATVDRLRMNRSAVVSARSHWVQAGWHPPTTMLRSD